ncbi:MAG TPA: hypothetical protein VM388_04440 [Acidimicrobiales bacterium]|nr:hypothetical protein [Acidimicrobiales bacterium]
MTLCWGPSPPLAGVDTTRDRLGRADDAAGAAQQEGIEVPCA